MKHLILACLIAITGFACASRGPINVGEVINPRYETVKEEVAAAVGAAEAKLALAADVADLAEARIRASALPDRVVDTILPAVEKYRTAVEKASQELAGVVNSLQEIDAKMAPVINARLELTNLVRLHGVLSELLTLLNVLEG